MGRLARAEPAPPPRYLRGYGLVEAPLERCVEQILTARLHGRPVAEPATDAGVSAPLDAGRDDAVAYLSVLTHPEMRRVLFAVNPRWTAVLNNRRDGSDFANDQHVFAQACQARTCRVVDSPSRIATVGPYKVRMEYPARIFDLQDAGGQTLRSVTCALDGSRWTFATHGAPLPAEADFPYGARRKSDRFTSEHLQSLVAAIGAGPPVAAAFERAERFVLTGIPRSPDHLVDVSAPADVDDPAYGYFRRGLSWVPHMRTHAESVVIDMTCAVLLNPTREPDARPHLRAARKHLGRKTYERVAAEAERLLRASGG